MQKRIPSLVQAYDKYVDREYYKLMPGFFSDYYVKIRTDRLENDNFIYIKCDNIPHKLYISGEEYKFTKI